MVKKAFLLLRMYYIRIFNTIDLQQAQTLLDKYGVDYVYIGPLERERYAPAGLQKFERLLNVAFQQDNVTIYQR